MKTTKAHRRWAWFVAGAIIVFAGWRYERHSDAVSAVPAMPSRNTAAAPRSPSRSPNTATALPPAAAPGPQERALDLAALREALAGRPDARAEEHRIIGFARFRDLVTAYSNSRSQMPAAERTRLARRILAELPEHVARNEIVPVQAEAMTAVLLDDAEPDPLARSADLAAAHKQWEAYSNQTVGPSPAQDPRYKAYAQRSRAMFEEVQATIPDTAQQQAVIAQRLKALRVELFDEGIASDAR